MANALPITVFLVDDHALVRTAIARMLESIESPNVTVIGEAQSGEEALEVLPRLRPDVVLMDLHMPGMGGYEASLRLRAIDPGIRIIVLTAQDDSPYPDWFRECGISAYVTKDASAEQLLEAILGAMQGDRQIPSTDNLPGQPEIAARMTQLSPRERQMLILLVRGMRPMDVARELDLSIKTVSTYKARLRQKLDCRSDMDLLRLALDYGITRLETPRA